MKRKNIFKYSGYFNLVNYGVIEKTVLFERTTSKKSSDGFVTTFLHVAFNNILYAEIPRFIDGGMKLCISDNDDWAYVLNRLTLQQKIEIEEYSLFKMITQHKHFYFLCSSYSVSESRWL